MKANIKHLDNLHSVKALSLVVDAWKANRGPEYDLAYNRVQSTMQQYIDGVDLSPDQTGELARQLLRILSNPKNDAEVQIWTDRALENVTEPVAQIDPGTLAIAGAILIGAILASRVEKVEPDSISFYEGVPENLPTVLVDAFENIFGN